MSGISKASFLSKCNKLGVNLSKPSKKSLPDANNAQINFNKLSKVTIKKLSEKYKDDHFKGKETDPGFVAMLMKSID